MSAWLKVLCVHLATMAMALAVNKQVIKNEANNLDPGNQGNNNAPNEEDDSKASYEFAYDVNDPLSNDFKSHREIRDGANVYGYYTFKEADGSTRVVNYKVGPDTGFEATVERLNLGETPEIRKPEMPPPPPPQHIQDNDPRRRPRIRPNARGNPAPVQQAPRRANVRRRPNGPYLQGPVTDDEVYQYKQDLRPGAIPEHARHDDLPVPNLQGDQNWKNSVIGRNHIRKQIAILAEQKAEEEAKKAAEAAAAAEAEKAEEAASAADAEEQQKANRENEENGNSDEAKDLQEESKEAEEPEDRSEEDEIDEHDEFRDDDRQEDDDDE